MGTYIAFSILIFMLIFLIAFNKACYNLKQKDNVWN